MAICNVISSLEELTVFLGLSALPFPDPAEGPTSSGRPCLFAGSYTREHERGPPSPLPQLQTPDEMALIFGGAQEREIASRYRDWARRAAPTWPRTGRVLRLLAEAYERDAREHDLRAELSADTQ